MLETFKSFLNDSMCHIWDDIVQTTINITPWVSLRCKEETTDVLGYTLEAYEMQFLRRLNTEKRCHGVTLEQMSWREDNRDNSSNPKGLSVGVLGTPCAILSHTFSISSH